MLSGYLQKAVWRVISIVSNPVSSRWISSDNAIQFLEFLYSMPFAKMRVGASDGGLELLFFTTPPETRPKSYAPLKIWLQKAHLHDFNEFWWVCDFSRMLSLRDFSKIKSKSKKQ